MMICNREKNNKIDQSHRALPFKQFQFSILRNQGAFTVILSTLLWKVKYFSVRLTGVVAGGAFVHRLE